jgi:hypothetical protein
MICGICNDRKCRKQFVQEDIILCYFCNGLYTRLLKKFKINNINDLKI